LKENYVWKIIWSKLEEFIKLKCLIKLLISLIDLIKVKLSLKVNFCKQEVFVWCFF
jgi:hypothetical protein